MVLVDTSVWIEFLRGKEHPYSALLESFLEEGEAALNGIVLAEICFGAKDSAQFEKYKKYFSALHLMEFPKNWEERVAEMGFLLKSKGHRPFIADSLIALTAISHNVPLLTYDRDFDPYSKYFGLKLEIV